MGTACEQRNCTVATTGICILSHPTLAQCPHYRSSEPPGPEGDSAGTGSEGSTFVATPGSPAPAAHLSAPARRFHAGIELGTEDAVIVSGARYAHLIGVLGSYDAGKTCYLLSLYMMASRGVLPGGYDFGGSVTLQGFEDRAWRVRTWAGGELPGQLADHTSLDSDRRAGLLHLSVRETAGRRRRHDLLFTDLPGEWTRNLIERAETAERFDFLHRADAIVLVVDGKLMTSGQRHGELNRMRHVVTRLADTVKVDRATPFVLLVSKCDEIGMRRPPAVDELRDHAASAGFGPKVILSAAFSRSPAVESGAGVFESVEHVLAGVHENSADAAAFRPPSPPTICPARSFCRFGTQAEA